MWLSGIVLVFLLRMLIRNIVLMICGYFFWWSSLPAGQVLVEVGVVILPTGIANNLVFALWLLVSGVSPER